MERERLDAGWAPLLAVSSQAQAQLQVQLGAPASRTLAPAPGARQGTGRVGGSGAPRNPGGFPVLSRPSSHFSLPGPWSWKKHPPGPWSWKKHPGGEMAEPSCPQVERASSKWPGDGGRGLPWLDEHCLLQGPGLETGSVAGVGHTCARDQGTLGGRQGAHGGSGTLSWARREVR